MNTANERALIMELNQKINEFCQKYNLFAGGCCYSAYLLSKCLTNLGVRHKIVIFQDHDIINETNFSKAINGDGVAHVAIQVTYKFHKMYIGDCTGLMNWYKYTKIPYKVRKYPSVDPNELLEAYQNNSWNCCYDPCHNLTVAKAIKKIYIKYANI